MYSLIFYPLKGRKRSFEINKAGHSSLMEQVYKNMNEVPLPKTKAFDIEKELTPMPMPIDLPLILGSSSSSRQKILMMLDWTFEILKPDIDEKAIRCDDHMLLPVLIAKAKAAAILEDTAHFEYPFVLLTADQIVYFQGTVREKPVGKEEATMFLESYSGNAVSTISAVVATHFPSGRQAYEVDVATVYWKEISPEIIENVVRRGDIYESAGGFRIEDDDLNGCIQEVQGTLDSVLGLPVEATIRVLAAVAEEPNEEKSYK